MTKQKSLQHVSVKAMETAPKGMGTIVTACLTAPVVDSDGEVYDTYSMQVPVKGGGYVTGKDLDDSQDLNIPIVTNHDLETGQINRDVRETIGRVMSGHLDDEGKLITKLYFSSIAEAQKIATLIDEGVLDDCLSLVYWHYGASSDGVIYNSEPFQLGVVWKSANQRARVIASSKSLKTEGNDVPKRDAETIRKELAAKQADVEALETELQDAEPVESHDAADDKQAPDADKAEDKKTEGDEVKADDAQDTQDDSNEEEAEEETNDQADESEDKEAPVKQEIAAKAAAGKVNTDAKQPTVQDDPDAARELAAKSLRALRAGDSAGFAQFQKEIAKVADGEVSKVVSAKADGRLAYEDIEGTYTQALIDQDFARLYKEAGGVASKVSKKHLTGNNPSYRKRIKASRYVFAPAPYGKEKVVQHNIDQYKEWKVQPWAVIAAWDEEAAEDSPFDYMQDVTNDLFDGALANEEFLIIGFDGGTYRGRTYERTGVLAHLKAAGGRYTQYAADKTFVPKLAAVLGSVRSTSRNATYSLTMSRSTLASLSGVQTDNGELLFAGAGQSINMGMLGNVNIVEVDDELLPNGQIIVGDWSMYQEVEKGGVKLLGSQHATVDGVSLYQTDGEALRARQRLGGGPLFNEAFWVMGTGTGITLPTQPAAQA